jgi:dihydrofolate reductase
MSGGRRLERRRTEAPEAGSEWVELARRGDTRTTTMSRQIVMFNRVTADGYFAASDGGLQWTVPEPEMDKEATGGMPGTDTVLFGRRTYELFQQFWPRAAEEPESVQDPHDSRRRSPEIRAMALFLNEVTKLVFSRTLKEVTWKNTRLLHGFDPREIEAMKKQPGKDMIIFGSGSIVSQLTEHGLIDEYRFVVNPILLGNGRELVSGVSKSLKLKLLEQKVYRSGNVMLRYAPANRPAA